MPEQSITEVTRRDIADYLTAEEIAWAGRKEEPAFLARIFDLDALPSTDSRFRDAKGDIWQHRVNNLDWPPDWVFDDPRFDLMHCSDEIFAKFLSEMLHPAVRPDREEVHRLVRAFNDLLTRDGWELLETRVLSGRPVFEARRRDAFHRPEVALALDSYSLLNGPAVLHEHLRRIDRDVATDPPGAIGSSKELVETVLKLILDDYDVRYGKGEDMGGLYKLVQSTLRLNVEAVKDSKRGSDASVKTLRALVTTLQGLTELRSALGLGHGRPEPSLALSRHARLAFNTAVALTEFLLDTWHERRAEERTAASVSSGDGFTLA